MNTELLDTALKMAPKDRVELAELILESIDYEEDEVKASWIAEVEDRMKAVKDGKSNLMNFNEKYNES